MTSKTRNRLMVLAIVAFPFVVLIGFILSEYISPPKTSLTQPETKTTGTNIYSPR